jgi:hypothetical protein
VRTLPSITELGEWQLRERPQLQDTETSNRQLVDLYLLNNRDCTSFLELKKESLHLTMVSWSPMHVPSQPVAKARTRNLGFLGWVRKF